MGLERLFLCHAWIVFLHIAMGNDLKDVVGQSLLISLTVLSWPFRPTEKESPR